MGLISKLLLLPVTGPWRGFRVILERIQDELQAQMMDEARVQGAMMQLEIRHGAGQVSDKEYEAQKAGLLEKLNQIRAYKEELLEEQAQAQAEVEAGSNTQ